MYRKVCGLVLVLSAWMLSGVAAADDGLQVGDPAPDFNLPGSDGQFHKLSDLRGRYVVVAFFPKAFTKG